MTPRYPLTQLQRRLLGAQDAKLRRCWHCGEWAYDHDDCRTCAAPAHRADLMGEEAAGA